MSTYEKIRQHYKPKAIAVLFIAESPPPPASTESSRHFYRSEKIRRNDRLFISTIKALYPETADKLEPELEQEKETWLKKFQTDGYYMIEALDTSLSHEITKKERRQLIAENLPNLIKKVTTLVSKHTKIILIKSNVFDVAVEPLRNEGFTVLNTALVDYPGRYNQHSYRKKLASLLKLV